MISEGSLVRYTRRRRPSGLAGGLCYNGIYLVISEPYLTERRRQNRMGWGCEVLVSGVGIYVDVENLEIVE